MLIKMSVAQHIPEMKMLRMGITKISFPVAAMHPITHGGITMLAQV
jgi:hypothetical protein